MNKIVCFLLFSLQRLRSWRSFSADVKTLCVSTYSAPLSYIKRFFKSFLSAETLLVSAPSCSHSLMSSLVKVSCPSPRKYALTLTARYYLGEVGFELMESTTPDGDVAKFIERRGEGIMLISFNVNNTRNAMEELKGKGYPFIGGARKFRDCEFAFLHPKAANGVLLEFIDDKTKP